MKVLFVVKSMVIETLGPMYLSAVVKQAGHQSKICELRDAVSMAKLWRPDIIGYSIMTGDVEKFRKVDEIIKDWWPVNGHRLTSIVGGSDPTFFPQGYDWADMVISGEAEDAIGELLQSPTVYGDIDSFPWPDRTDFKDHKIRDFIASRGCGNDCGYCYNGAWAKLFPFIPRIRTRDAEDVVKEIDSVNPEFVYFQDSTFGVSMKWMRQFSNIYRRSVNIPYHAHLRPNQVSEERVLLLHDSNCVSVKIALETASDRLRKLINRGNTNNDDAIKASRLLKKWDIKLIMQNILGLPTATIEDDLGTLEINIQCKPAYAWSSIFQPYPSTALGDWCKKEGLYSGDYSEISDSFFDKSVLNITEEHKEQVVCLQRIFAFCTEMQVMPKISDLTYKELPMFIHKAMRKLGDKRMFPGIS
jgi:anaerobic magnesium-protoporphyrin IX monomethyl ester cyclase